LNPQKTRFDSLQKQFLRKLRILPGDALQCVRAQIVFLDLSSASNCASDAKSGFGRVELIQQKAPDNDQRNAEVWILDRKSKEQDK